MTQQTRQHAGAIQIVDPEPLELEYGAILPSLEICYESWGRLSAARDNVVLVCPAFSAHSHAASHPDDPAPGWWEEVIGPGRAFDTDRFFVLCPALLGSCCGTTGPQSEDPTTGRPYGRSFPIITVRDIVAVHARLLAHLGIERVYAVAGGSLGAMEALELAVRYPGLAERAAVISGTDRTRPYTVAIRHLGRRAIELGRELGGGTEAELLHGLKLAREIGTLFYRSRRELNQRFPWHPTATPSRHGITFEVQSYLDYQAEKILGNFDPDAYLTMSLAMDLFDVWRGTPGPEKALEAVDTEFLVVGVEEDQLIPLDEQETLHATLQAAGKKSAFRPISSRIGHDAFLVEMDTVNQLLGDFLG